ncbi:hypothetical protein [Paraburkholderia sacchari]|uniref:hypothetical protein n=1 Tax=Paraburkholderia sacchari TaxID=159450 RepID=UPI003D96AC34
MTDQQDPIAAAAAQLDAAPSSTEPSMLERAEETIHELEAKIEHLMHPEGRAPGESESAQAAAPLSPAVTSSDVASIQSDAPEVAQAGEIPVAAPGVVAAETVESSSTGATEQSSLTSAASQAAVAAPGEHPHTAILRSLTTTLRRKFNVFDGELEALLKDAESHL